VLAYRAAGAGGIALLVAAQMLPAAALVPFVNRAADTMPRERLLLLTDLGRLVVALAACALESTGQPRLALLPLAAGLTVATGASNSVRRALLPLLVGSPAELTAVGVASTVVQAAAQTTGPVLAAILFSLTSPAVVLLAAAVCFAAAALSDVRLPSTNAISVRPRTESGALVTARAIAAIRAQPELRLVTALFAAKNLGRGALNVLIVTVSLQLIQVGNAGVGWLTAAVGAGGVLGGIGATRLVGKQQLAAPMAYGLAIWGTAFLVIALAPGLSVAIAALVGLGIGNSLTDVAGYTLVGRWARDDALARIYGVHEGIRALAITTGAAATALVIGIADTRLALVAAGGALVAVAVAGRLHPRAETAEPSAEYVELLRSNPLFGWLAPVGLDRLASTLEPLELSAGSVLLSEGAIGDRAYLVAEGELVARRDGHEIGRIAAGGVAGEIALLHDAPRMATVHAVTPSRLLAIERDEFLAAATGSPGARAASEELVEARLSEAAAALSADVPLPKS
jgi:MFS family permease